MPRTSSQQHLDKLIDKNTKRLQGLEVQLARLGFSADPSVQIEIDEIRERLATLTQQEPRYPETHLLRELAPVERRPARYKGLIVMVGPGRAGVSPTTQAAWPAISYHLGGEGEEVLRYCWLISSGERQKKDEQDAIHVARDLKKACEARGVKVKIWPLADGYDAREVFDLVNLLFEREVPAAKLQENEVICDFTGGTKLMSVGMALACGERRAMQCMVYESAPTGATQDTQAKISVPVLVRFAPEGSA